MDDSRTEHYVQLISNASLDVFPHNVISEFTTQLVQPLRLDGGWEIGMHSCSYHRNWLNLTEANDASLELIISKWQRTDNKDGLYVTLGLVKSKLTLPFPGNYSTPESMLRALHALRFLYKTPELHIEMTLGDIVKVKFNPSTQRITVHWKGHPRIKNDMVKLTFSDKLRKMLGMRLICPDIHLEQDYVLVGNPDDAVPDLETNYPFPPFTRETIQSSVEFPDPVNFVDVFNLFLYTDIVKATRLGDADSEYLFMLPVQGEEGEYVHFEVQNIVYKDVKSSLVPTIHLKVADFKGDRVKFNHGSGEFTTLLHLRKVS